MSDLAPFLGRFHPLLVHLPIGFLLLAGWLHVLSWRRRRTPGSMASSLDAAIGPIVVLGALTAAFSAVSGYLLGTSEGWSGAAFTRHQAAGIGVAALSALAAAARWWSYTHRFYGMLFGATLATTVAAGHLGATLTHGDGYLTEHAPPSIRALVGATTGETTVGRPIAGSADRAVVYAALVEPVLRSRCVGCHGPDKAERDLRLDSPDAIRKGGKSGPALVAGRAAASDVVRRIYLPASHKDAMPPKGRPSVTPAEAAVLRWWVDQGASFEATLAELEVGPDVRGVIEAFVGPIGGGPRLPGVDPGPVDSSARATLEKLGLGVTTVAAGSPFVQVHATNAGRRFGDAEARALKALARQVVWLDLSGTSITDRGLEIVGQCTNLTRLHLNRTAVTDAGLAHLTALGELEYLNLYGTGITDAGLAHLTALTRLRAVYVWQTAVTAGGAERLKAALPRLELSGAVRSGPTLE